MSKPTPPPAPEPPPSLEAAMERLDAIVKEMETGSLPLETLITRYEEGAALSKYCQEKLDRAGERIQIISRDAAGKPTLTAFETDE